MKRFDESITGDSIFLYDSKKDCYFICKIKTIIYNESTIFISTNKENFYISIDDESNMDILGYMYLDDEMNFKKISTSIYKLMCECDNYE